MAKLQSLKSTLPVARGRLSMLQPLTTQTTERKRGWAGVQDRQRIRQRDQGLCQRCKRAGRTRLGEHVDHTVPLWKGGSDEDGNKELLCRPCHDEKSAAEAAERAAGG